MNIDNQIIFEEFFKIVSDSVEWGRDEDDNKYGCYIDGLCDMTKQLLDKINENQSAEKNQ